MSGGVAAHGTNNAATLTLADDEAAPPPVTCSAQNPIFNDTSLRILETGETTYCVRLTTAPSGGDTTVTIGRIGGGATVSPGVAHLHVIELPDAPAGDGDRHG